MKILITGGAGYIGSTIASACIDSGITPILIDDLSTGRREFTKGREFYESDFSDSITINKIFNKHKDIRHVIHCAAKISVPESVSFPELYFENNVNKSRIFFEILQEHECNNIIFSSSASVYKSSSGSQVSENSPIGAASPYAQTKIEIEELLKYKTQVGQLHAIALRYFNPIGADPKLRSGPQDLTGSHVLSKLLSASKNGTKFEITGTDYATRDGSGIRDYVHVWDIARAHILAVLKFNHICNDLNPFAIINLGSGEGTTVLELINAFEKTVNCKIQTEESQRRPGDVQGVFASNELANELLNWQPKLSLSNAISDLIKWDEFITQKPLGD